MADIETAVGRRFGDPSDPLLVSVRSGAPVSMPGMMDTILNLGLNDATTAGLARSGTTPSPGPAGSASPRASVRSSAWTTSRRTPGSSCARAIEAVFRSWNSDRARAYRDRRASGRPRDGRHRPGDGLRQSRTGFRHRRLFTRNPATGEPTLYGDVMFEAQGEDVVAGTHQTEPIAVLDERMPAVAAELRDHAARLERHYADLCDIEFTIEDGRLWMLQVRVGKRSPQAALRMAVDMAEDDVVPAFAGRGGRAGRVAARRAARGRDGPQRRGAAL